MTPLTHERYCDEIVLRTDALRAAVADGDLDATVPTCPEWTLRDLAVHVGGAHRWVGEIVRTRATEEVPEERVPHFTPDGDDPAVLDAWLAEGRRGPPERCGRRGRSCRSGPGPGTAAPDSGPGA